MKSAVTTLCLGLVLSLFPRAALGADRKIGVVDLQRAIMEVEEGQQARAALQVEIAKAQRTYEARVEELRKQQQGLERAAAQMTPEQKTREVEKFQAKYAEAAAHTEKEKAKLGLDEQQLLARILKKMEGVVAKIAAEHGFTMVLDRRAVVLPDPSVDITDEVIRVYNTPVPKP